MDIYISWVVCTKAPSFKFQSSFGISKLFFSRIRNLLRHDAREFGGSGITYLSYP
jgi:hypothetical protein